MQRNLLRMLGLAALVTLLQSCGDPKSSSTSGPDGGPVPTSRMTIDLRVEASDSGIAVVRANLNDGLALGKSYRLDGGDFFRACVNGVCRIMADNDSVIHRITSPASTSSPASITSWRSIASRTRTLRTRALCCLQPLPS